jgi:alpha-beta hydrolase superfamily lysophospholipase
VAVAVQTPAGQVVQALTSPRGNRIVWAMSDAEMLSIPAPDGTPLACRKWAPAPSEPPRGIVVYLHGIQSHGGWYEGSGRYLADRGLAVYMPDRRGSGLNSANRGHADSWEQLADDVLRVEDRALADAGRQVPVLLVGVSWGGKLAAMIAAMHSGRYAGLALLCPGICPQRDVTARTKARIARALATGNDFQRFEIPLSDPALFTATPRWLEFLASDPLALREATARFLFESRRLDQCLAAAAGWITQPLLLALASCDRIIDNGQTRQFAGRTGSRRMTVIEYPGAHHTLEFEPDPQPVWSDLAAWLLKCCRNESESETTDE